MSTPTIDERCAAQAAAGYGLHPEVLAREMPNLMTPDELRAVLVENEELRRQLNRLLKCQDKGAAHVLTFVLMRHEELERQRDQWRECARGLAALVAVKDSVVVSSSAGQNVLCASVELRAALARFDALVKEEKQ